MPTWGGLDGEKDIQASPGGMEARGSAGSTAPRIGGAWDRGSALQTSRTPETAPPKLVVFEVIALVMETVTAKLSRAETAMCKPQTGGAVVCNRAWRRRTRSRQAV
ncbi:hypothetical protein GCM10010203_66190 [Actinomadura yumaensis]